MACVINELKLKILIHRKDHRVLFAEAGKPVVDFLFSLLSLPLATVFTILTKGPGMSGCLKNLYGSVQKLSCKFLVPFQTKDGLLMPKVHVSGSLGPLSSTGIESSRTKEFYICEAYKYDACRANVATNPTAICPECHSPMKRKATYLLTDAEKTREEGGYVKGVITYMVMDNLTVTPMSSISSIAVLKNFDIKDVDDLEEKVITLNVDEAKKLLKAALESTTVLTDVFLGPKPDEKEPFAKSMIKMCGTEAHSCSCSF